jgi:Transposase IS116/IS110/IS902 family
VANEDVERFVTSCVKGWRKSKIRERRLRQAHLLACESIGYEDGPAYRRGIFSMLDEITFRQQQRELDLQNLEDACCGFRAWSRLQTIPGVGPKLAAIILSAIGDPQGYKSVSQVMRLAGLNLCQATSGTSLHGAPVISHAGKAELRFALYMATQAAVRVDDGFREAYWDALGKRGGPGRKGAKKICLVKLSAKMLRVAFAVMRDDVPYDSEFLLRSMERNTDEGELQRQRLAARSAIAVHLLSPSPSTCQDGQSCLPTHRRLTEVTGLTGLRSPLGAGANPPKRPPKNEEST